MRFYDGQNGISPLCGAVAPILSFFSKIIRRNKSSENAHFMNQSSRLIGPLGACCGEPDAFLGGSV